MFGHLFFYAEIFVQPFVFCQRGSNQATDTPTIASDEDFLSLLMEQQDLFVSSTRSRLTKLQIIQQMWDRNDVRGAISAMEKMSDHAVSADMASVLMEKSEMITLDLCTSILPVVTDLLESKTDRHLTVSLEFLVKLTIHTMTGHMHFMLNALQMSHETIRNMLQSTWLRESSFGSFETSLYKMHTFIHLVSLSRPLKFRSCILSVKQEKRCSRKCSTGAHPCLPGSYDLTDHTLDTLDTES